jgi:uncharacterized protein
MKITRVDDDPRPAVASDLSVVGIVGTAPLADATLFPLNTPVHVFSDDSATLTKLGADGTLKASIELLNAQLGEFQVAARVVIVRIAQGGTGEAEDVTATIANIVGDATARTGIHALRNAGPVLGVIPRLIIVPGYTSQRTGTNANAVCAALPAILDGLLAHAIVDGPATSLQAYTDWRETIQSDRIIPVETAVKVGVDGVVTPASPTVAGIAVRRDYEHNGVPSHSWANQPVQGIVGPNRPIEFSLTDGATEGQAILAGNGGVIVRGELGVETAIASGGFVYIGTDNCSEDTFWQFYNVTRMRDYIHIMLLKTLRYYLGRFNIDGQTLEAIKQTIEFALRDLKAGRHILGYKVGFTRDQNSPEQLRLGKFTIDFAAEEPPVLRFLGVRSARYRPALDALLDELLSQIDAQ